MKRSRTVPTVALISAMLVMVSTVFVLAASPTVQELTYRTVGDRKLQLHIHYPPGWKATDTRPAMIFFFGGGWTGGKVTQFESQAEYFASRGMVTARADYRVKSRDRVTPDACVADARSAVRYMRKNAKKLGIDPNKLIASGGSAGGHLAACMMIEKSVEADGDDLSIATIPQVTIATTGMIMARKIGSVRRSKILLLTFLAPRIGDSSSAEGYSILLNL